MKHTADVVIAGGGCMGCSVAWHLAQRGITNVVLLEREAQLGAGSTGKNAGGFRHQFSNSANIELSIESIALMKRFEDIVGTPIDFHQDGYLFLLSKSANVETFKKNVALQQKHGVDVRWVSNDDARELSPGPRSHRRQGRDLLPVGRRRRSEWRHDGIREGRAGARASRSFANAKSPARS